MLLSMIYLALLCSLKTDIMAIMYYWCKEVLCVIVLVIHS